MHPWAISSQYSQQLGREDGVLVGNIPTFLQTHLYWDIFPSFHFSTCSSISGPIREHLIATIPLYGSPTCFSLKLLTFMQSAIVLGFSFPHPPHYIWCFSESLLSFWLGKNSDYPFPLWLYLLAKKCFSESSWLQTKKNKSSSVKEKNNYLKG